MPVGRGAAKAAWIPCPGRGGCAPNAGWPPNWGAGGGPNCCAGGGPNGGAGGGPNCCWRVGTDHAGGVATGPGAAGGTCAAAGAAGPTGGATGGAAAGPTGGAKPSWFGAARRAMTADRSAPHWKQNLGS